MKIEEQQEHVSLQRGPQNVPTFCSMRTVPLKIWGNIFSAVMFWESQINLTVSCQGVNKNWFIIFSVWIEKDKPNRNNSNLWNLSLKKLIAQTPLRNVEFQKLRTMRIKRSGRENVFKPSPSLFPSFVDLKHRPGILRFICFNMPTTVLEPDSGRILVDLCLYSNWYQFCLCVMVSKKMLIGWINIAV